MDAINPTILLPLEIVLIEQMLLEKSLTDEEVELAKEKAIIKRERD